MSDGETFFLGLGSNLGNRVAHLELGLAALSSRSEISLLRVSPYFITDPVDAPGPRYLNAAARGTTTLSPAALLYLLLATELETGRQRNGPGSPRTLDLDLLFYGDRLIREADLVVPHPRLHHRRFVLEPLCWIAPDFVHPELRRTVAELLAGLPA